MVRSLQAPIRGFASLIASQLALVDDHVAVPIRDVWKCGADVVQGHLEPRITKNPFDGVADC